MTQESAQPSAAAAEPAASAASEPTSPDGGSTNGSGPEPPKGAVAHARHVVIGFLMGSAEVVPGVSGGTVALVGGVYTRLIDAVRDGVDVALTFARGRFGEGMARVRRLDWVFLVPLVASMAVAVLTLARVIEHYLEEEPVPVAGLFLGLVLGSIPVAFRMIRRVDLGVVLIVAGVGATLFILLGARQETVGEAGDAATAPLWAYPLAASVAICAWILPGVSGSLMLVMMGMYSHVFGAVNDRDLPPLVLFAIGAAIGLALFSKLLAWLLDHHHDRMVAAMVGLMIGSTRVLWPWPGGLESTKMGSPDGEVALSVGLAIVGFAAVVLLGRFGGVTEEEVRNG